MQRNQHVRSLMRIYLAIIVSYFLVKFALRPFVLEREFGRVLEIFVLSYPNFCEAVAGTLFLTFALLTLNGVLLKRKPKLVLEAKFLYLIAVILTGVYVLLQEFKVHNLGGANVYDPYDVVFSVLGLVVGYLYLVWAKPIII